ncbi:ankyrin repeat domain-containing protein [Mariniflexile litorale]|uniref:Ankyrin repeat domain-containing protein n=1 Tax=Mariniflexile litorale TaxID=3045158 RepID=A0AAU7E9N5_9FLAO|nr:ankyrin repeat domain-containing protein [Mariniflexile sp. KMM 9835]MDQ8212508.1 ankyrin repeat domain-containing protein [Mariniflexile sp. KMM 9835]
MMKKSLILLLLVPTLIFAQRGQQSTNELHNRTFWQTLPDVATVKQKIKEGNDPVTPNPAAFDAICFAIMAKAPVETVEYLLSLPGNDINKPTHDGRSYLMWAGNTGNLELMKLLISKGADTKIVGSHGFNWFTFTVNSGHENTDIYDLMVANGIDLKETNRAGANAILLLAPHNKDGKIIEYFQQKGLDIHATDKQGNNILFYAAKGGNINLIKKYISQGFDYKKINAQGENMVLFASHGGRGYSNPLEVYHYFDGLGLNLTLTNKEGQNALHNIASNTKDVAIVDFFINKGIDIHQEDNDGNTAFLNAAKGNNNLVLQKLAPLTKNINQQNKEGFSAITYATQRINLEAFEMLKEKGANPNIVDTNGNNLYYHLFNAYSRRNGEDFETYVNALTSTGVSFKNASKKESPLHIAISKGDEKLIQKALELGADINQKNGDGLTPLHLAAMKATNAKLLQLLISKGADKKTLTDFDESAYDLAKENELLSPIDITFLKQS